jgi:serine protease Do
MSTRRITLVYAVLIAVASLAVGMVIASRLDLAPRSEAQSLAVPSANSAPLSGPVDATTFRNIAKAASPFVVNIRTRSKQKAQDLTEFFGGADPFGRFFGNPQGRGNARPREQVVEAVGTGFVISKEGLILTNNHVVEGATDIFVAFGESLTDEEYKAKLVGRDQLSDSALIQLEDKPAAPLAEAKFGDSSQMQTGDWVMAVGNPFGFGHTATVGIISATKRPFTVTEGRSQDVLQTDAAINPGNSGGPLLNIRGEVIGINTAIISNSQTEGNIGIGFAIPINLVRELLPQLRAGKVVRGRIGVTVRDVPKDFVIEPGDVIIEFNGKPVASRDELIKMVAGTKPATTVPIKVMRDKQEKSLTITIEELDLDAETGATSRTQTAQDDASAGFGLSLGNITPNIARQLRLPAGTTGAVVMDVDSGGPADTGNVAQYDVILKVNGVAVTGAADASRILQKIAAGGRAALLVWKTRQGEQQWLTIKKE